MTLPIIDLGSSAEGAGASLARIAAEVGAACRDVGFFDVVNHGVAPELIAKAFAQSHEFFALPVADKRTLAIETVSAATEAFRVLHEALDPARGPDMKEAFNVGLELAADDPELLAGAPFRSRNAWPGVPGFRETLLSYYDACSALGDRIARSPAILASIAISSTTNSTARWRRCGSCTIPLRPEPRPRPPAQAIQQRRNLTLLATDDVGGLEVRTRAGQWIEAPVVPAPSSSTSAIASMRWTNDVYVSTPHRVVNRSARERY